MTRQSTALQITQVGPTTWTLRGYTKPYADDLKAAGATWDAQKLVWRYEGVKLPEAITALVKGLTTLEAPAPILVGGDGVVLALKQTVTVGGNPIVGLIVDMNVKAGKVCVTRPNPSATTNMTHWVAANKVRQADSPIGEKPTLDTDATKWGKAVRAQEKRAREAMEAAKSDPAKVDAALDEIVKAVEIGQARPQMEDIRAVARDVLQAVRKYVYFDLAPVPKEELHEGDLLLDMSPGGSLWQMIGWDGDKVLLLPRLVERGSRASRPQVHWFPTWRRVTISEAAWIARLQRAYRDVTKSSLKKPLEPARIVYAAYESDEFPDYDWGSAPGQVDVIDEALYPRYSIGEKVFTRPGNHPAIVREVFADNRYEVFDGFGLCVLHADWLIKSIIFPPTGTDVWTARAVPSLLPAKLPDETDTWVKQVNAEARRLDQMADVNIPHLRAAAVAHGLLPEAGEQTVGDLMQKDKDAFVELASGGTLKSVDDLIATKTDDPTSSWWIDENDHVFHIDNPPPMDAFAILRGPFDTEAEARAMLKPKRSSSAFQPSSDVTPLRQQYLGIKAQYPDCILFFRLGDFYELFDEDAELAAKELDLVLTSRPVNRKQRVPMAGVPHHALEQYVAKLVEKGYHVAVCEQISEPNGGGLVERRVERVVEPCQD